MIIGQIIDGLFSSLLQINSTKLLRLSLWRFKRNLPAWLQSSSGWDFFKSRSVYSFGSSHQRGWCVAP